MTFMVLRRILNNAATAETLLKSGNLKDIRQFQNNCTAFHDWCLNFAELIAVIKLSFFILANGYAVANTTKTSDIVMKSVNDNEL